jgi:predicted membrane-bound spermidine synthase
LIAALVFISGGAALVFQVAWMRELRLVFGATTAAVSAVLAIFMIGLGLGSVVLGQRADRSPNPLRLYGVLEAGIAASAFLTPLLISLMGWIYINLGGQETLGVGGATAIRLLLAAAVMIVPTFLMGGTLPAAVRAVTPPDDTHRRALGLIYGANTLGAVTGAAVATFFALEHLGTRMTLWAGCAAGMFAGVVAIASSRGLSSNFVPRRASAAVEDTSSSNRGGRSDAPADNRTLVIYFTAAVLGFTFFALEIVWYRMLAPILGGTAFTFGLILCIALFGIGVGGIAYNVLFSRLRPTWSALALTCGCEALLIIVPFAIGDRLALFAAAQQHSVASFAELVAGWSYVAGIVVLPVALVSGLQFPLLIALQGQARRNVSKHIGSTYAWNTFGAIAGSLFAGFGAMPLLSAPGAWQAIAIVLAMLSIVLLVANPARDHVSSAVVAALGVITIGATFFQGPTAVWRHSGIGVGRGIGQITDPNLIRQWMNEHRQTLVWEADGVESSIGISALDGLSFVVNGKSDGNALNDAPTQVGMAILGTVLHGDAKTALVIGLGTGETAGWLAEMDGIERVDVVELEPAIDEMAVRSRELNWDVLNHPRVRRIYNDGREFVLTTDAEYDLVISEPSNPYRAGVATLYTTDFYRALRERLNASGIFIQWLQAYDIDEQTVYTVLATARSVFPHIEVWQTLPGDLQLVCSPAPLEYSEGVLAKRIAGPTVSEALATVWKVTTLEGFMGHLTANSKWADQIRDQSLAPVNTDDRTILEYSFAKTVGKGTPFLVEATRERLAQAQMHHAPGVGIDWNAVELRRQEFNLLFNGQLSKALLPKPEDGALIESLIHFRENDFSGALLRWPTQYRNPVTAIQGLVLAKIYAELARPECLDLISAVEAEFPIEAAALRATYYFRAGKFVEAAAELEGFYSMLAKSPWVLHVVAESALARTIEVARADRDLAPRLYPLVSQPFASYRFEYLRRMVRLAVAEQIGPERIAEALEAMEPHMRWTGPVLQSRLQAYEAVNHPLKAQARRDLQWFVEHQTAN